MIGNWYWSIVSSGFGTGFGTDSAIKMIYFSTFFENSCFTLALTFDTCTLRCDLQSSKLQSLFQFRGPLFLKSTPDNVFSQVSTYFRVCSVKFLIFSKISYFSQKFLIFLVLFVFCPNWPKTFLRFTVNFAKPRLLDSRVTLCTKQTLARHLTALFVKIAV